jgi:hypothetical protein
MDTLSTQHPPTNLIRNHNGNVAWLRVLHGRVEAVHILVALGEDAYYRGFAANLAVIDLYSGIWAQAHREMLPWEGGFNACHANKAVIWPRQDTQASQPK